MDDQYSFKVLDNSDNSIFIKFFNFYLSFISNQELANIGFSELTGVSGSNGFIKVIIFIVSLLLVGLIGLLIYQNRKALKEKISSSVSKDNRFKYIDILTSLKNRNYLNDNIDAWDESLVYPQGIIIVDLNNIAYINDNYGREEGDKVITEAANILIINQLQNSEIIRTDGNEFLIYMVGYNEKQIISYLRRLGKELKNLSHGFGAASGYSIINDAIKTIDDAVNEATLDMKNNKEDIDY
jgi:diguanylate cyclase (GGDEF)-like protein